MKSLLELRDEIDFLDKELFELLLKRKNLVLDVARFKKANNLEIFQEGREVEVLEAKKKMAEEFGLNEDFICSLYQLIMDNSKEEQKSFLNDF